MISGIYMIRNTVNDKVYIGQSRDIKNRFSCYKSGCHNKHLQRAFNKYGFDKFEFVIIDKCETSEMNDKEKFYIRLFNSTNPLEGYNKSYGGEGHVHLQETKDKISLDRKRKGLAKGENNPMYGVKLEGEKTGCTARNTARKLETR